ncbi:MAG: DUF3303 family protein [Chitinophagaceae bacterium]|nr:DUF3303 family protein [Chitinophagaceae bacterium]
MQYMVIERFHPGKVKIMYQRFTDEGRMLPDGVSFINSWINEDVTVCYQVMEAETPGLLQQWISRWNDIVDFEVIPVISSAQAKEKVFAEK